PPYPSLFPYPTLFRSDRAFRDAIRAAMMLENYANEGVEDFVPYDPIRPEIKWKDGLPDNEMELAQIMNIRTGGKPTIDVMTAIKDRKSTRLNSSHVKI